MSFQSILSQTKQAFKKLGTLAVYALGVLAVLLLVISVVNKNDVIANTAMITNLAANSGGSGTILSSGKDGSYILTNAHVCKVAQNGGYVSNSTGRRFMVESYRASETQDLCLIKVLGDFGVWTAISNTPPQDFYEAATVSGHPELLPTVVTKGHFSGHASISVMVDLKPCSQEDLQNPATGMMCFFLGGMPIMRQYDSQLVTATIMPGSSGSGVYNKHLELSGVIFAGSHDLGYAWIVPFENMSNFLQKEVYTIADFHPNNEFSLVPKDKESFGRQRRSLKMLCDSFLGKHFEQVCTYVNRDLIWYK